MDESSNAFNGTVTFTTDSGSAVTIVDTTALDLVALTAASLNVTAGGAVTDSGTGDCRSDHDQCEWAGHTLDEQLYLWNACFDWSQCGSD